MYFFTAIFNVNCKPSAFIVADNTLDKLETIVTPIGSLQLIETDSVDKITAGLRRNVYFPPNTGWFFIFNLVDFTLLSLITI